MITCSSVHKHNSIILPSRTHTQLTLSPLPASLAHVPWPVSVLFDLWERAKTFRMDQSHHEWVILDTTNTDWAWKSPQMHADSNISSKTQTHMHTSPETHPWVSLSLTHRPTHMHVQAISSHCRCCMFASSLCDSWPRGSVLCNWTAGKWSV